MITFYSQSKLLKPGNTSTLLTKLLLTKEINNLTQNNSLSTRDIRLKRQYVAQSYIRRVVADSQLRCLTYLCGDALMLFIY